MRPSATGRRRSSSSDRPSTGSRVKPAGGSEHGARRSGEHQQGRSGQPGEQASTHLPPVVPCTFIYDLVANLATGPLVFVHAHRGPVPHRPPQGGGSRRAAGHRRAFARSRDDEPAAQQPTSSGRAQAPRTVRPSSASPPKPSGASGRHRTNHGRPTGAHRCGGTTAPSHHRGSGPRGKPPYEPACLFRGCARTPLRHQLRLPWGKDHVLGDAPQSHLGLARARPTLRSA